MLCHKHGLCAVSRVARSRDLHHTGLVLEQSRWWKESQVMANKCKVKVQTVYLWCTESVLKTGRGKGIYGVDDVHILQIPQIRNVCTSLFSMQTGNKKKNMHLSYPEAKLSELDSALFVVQFLRFSWMGVLLKHANTACKLHAHTSWALGQTIGNPH